MSMSVGIGAGRQDDEEWSEDGVTWRMVFGQPKMISATAEWDDVVSDEGEIIEWETEISFAGTYLGSKTLQVADQRTGELKDATLLLLEDNAGIRRSTWAGYALEQVAAKCTKGDQIQIQFVGKKEFGKSGATMAAFNIKRKSPSAVAN